MVEKGALQQEVNYEEDLAFQQQREPGQNVKVSGTGQILSTPPGHRAYNHKDKALVLLCPEAPSSPRAH